MVSIKRVFLKKFLSQYPSYLKEMFRKRKEKKMGAAQCMLPVK